MNIFYNKDQDRLRAGWRLFLQFIIMFFLLGSGQFLIGLVNIESSFLLGTIISLVAFTASVWISTYYLDKRSFKSLGLQIDGKWMRELGIGVAIAAGVMSFIFIIELLLGWITFTGFGWDRSWNSAYPVPLLGYFAGMMLVGFYEELVFRGYQITNMIEGFSGDGDSYNQVALWAVGVSSAIFGAMHAGNPNASIISTINIIFAGVVLALPYLITGSLALSVGIHAAWNFFQGGIFGLPVSGTPARSSLLQIRETGPDLFTGGSFGPEAGLTGVFGLFLITFLVFFYAKNAGYTPEVHETLQR